MRTPSGASARNSTSIASSVGLSAKITWTGGTDPPWGNRMVTSGGRSLPPPRRASPSLCAHAGADNAVTIIVTAITMAKEKCLRIIYLIQTRVPGPLKVPELAFLRCW